MAVGALALDITRLYTPVILIMDTKCVFDYP